MALIQMNFMSGSLMRTVPVQVILPVDKLTFPGMPEREEKPFKTLYLLHGVFGNYTDWVSQTNIQSLAEEANLAVVMPSGDNLFYVDDPYGGNMYGEFIGKELVEITRKAFPLSRAREDTFIAGLSMGGYGALRNGMKYHETFGYIGALSSALIVDGIEKRTNDSPMFIETRAYAERVFGDLDKVAASDKNPWWLARHLTEQGVELPKIYMTVGYSDSLRPLNESLAACLRELGADVTFEEDAGAHEWDFWGRSIKKVLDWLPLEGGDAGITSGNVGI